MYKQIGELDDGGDGEWWKGGHQKRSGEKEEVREESRREKEQKRNAGISADGGEGVFNSPKSLSKQQRDFILQGPCGVVSYGPSSIHSDATEPWLPLKGHPQGSLSGWAG